MSEEIRNTEAMENEVDVVKEVTEMKEESKIGKVVSTIGNGVKKHGKKVAIGAVLAGAAFALGRIVVGHISEDDEFDHNETDYDDTTEVEGDVDIEDKDYSEE